VFNKLQNIEGNPGLGRGPAHAHFPPKDPNDAAEGGCWLRALFFSGDDGEHSFA
jgi:hypothetical protein